VFSPLRLPLSSFHYGAALPPSLSRGLPPSENVFAIRNRKPQRSPTGYGPWVGLAPSWLASRKAPSPSPASNKMLEVHRCRQIEWSPSPVVALATSVNGGAVAAARENGVIEIWSVAAGSVGWHCQLVPRSFSYCLCSQGIMWPHCVGGFGRVWFGLPFSREELRGPGELQEFPYQSKVVFALRV
jgi:hypothetical protein